MGSGESKAGDAERTAELVRARDEAIAAGRARADFLARMSHEIRTPMNAVIGMAELLLMERLEPQVADGIRTIRSAADALLALINDILDFSKIDAGGLSLQPVDFDLDAQLSSIVELMTAPARKAGIELRVLIDPRTAGSMYGDEARLRQVLINLVGNAVKFTETGFVELRARIAEERGRDVCIEFCVADSGPGIAKEVQESIFEVFEQGDGSSTRTSRRDGARPGHLASPGRDVRRPALGRQRARAGSAVLLHGVAEAFRGEGARAAPDHGAAGCAGRGLHPARRRQPGEPSDHRSLAREGRLRGPDGPRRAGGALRLHLGRVRPGADGRADARPRRNCRDRAHPGLGIDPRHARADRRALGRDRTGSDRPVSSRRHGRLPDQADSSGRAVRDGGARGGCSEGVRGREPPHDRAAAGDPVGRRRLWR